jgi:TatD DNase family protein
MSKHKKTPIPIFEHAIIETHCHLDYLKEYSLEEVI